MLWHQRGSLCLQTKSSVCPAAHWGTQPPWGGCLAPAGLLPSLLVAYGEGSAVLGVHPGTAQVGRFLGCVLDGLGFQPWLPTA